MSKRYTAVVKIVEVTESTTTREYGKDVVTPGKDTELANLVVRAKSLNVLKTKLKAHIDLTEEL